MKDPGRIHGARNPQPRIKQQQAQERCDDMNYDKVTESILRKRAREEEKVQGKLQSTAEDALSSARNMRSAADELAAVPTHTLMRVLRSKALALRIAAAAIFAIAAVAGAGLLVFGMRAVVAGHGDSSAILWTFFVIAFDFCLLIALLCWMANPMLLRIWAEEAIGERSKEGLALRARQEGLAKDVPMPDPSEDKGIE